MSDVLRDRENIPEAQEAPSRSLARILKERAYFCARYVGACIPRAQATYHDVPSRAFHHFDPAWNTKQDEGSDHCGVHCVTGLLRTLGRHDAEPSELLRKTRYKWHWGIHPVSMERLLQDEGFEPEPMQFGHLSLCARIRAIEQQLVRRPLIALMRDPVLGLHYTMLLGYDHDDRFMLMYDPKIGPRTKRGAHRDLPGNRILNYKRVLSRMDEGHVLGRNRNYALGVKPRT